MKISKTFVFKLSTVALDIREIWRKEEEEIKTPSSTDWPRNVRQDFSHDLKKGTSSTKQKWTCMTLHTRQWPQHVTFQHVCTWLGLTLESREETVHDHTLWWECLGIVQNRILHVHHHHFRYNFLPTFCTIHHHCNRECSKHLCCWSGPCLRKKECFPVGLISIVFSGMMLVRPFLTSWNYFLQISFARSWLPLQMWIFEAFSLSIWSIFVEEWCHLFCPGTILDCPPASFVSSVAIFDLSQPFSSGFFYEFIIITSNMNFRRFCIFNFIVFWGRSSIFPSWTNSVHAPSSPMAAPNTLQASQPFHSTYGRLKFIIGIIMKFWSLHIVDLVHLWWSNVIFNIPSIVAVMKWMTANVGKIHCSSSKMNQIDDSMASCTPHCSDNELQTTKKQKERPETG